MVRNKLKLKAENAEIDALFEAMDAHGGGTIEFNELVQACHMLSDAANEETSSEPSADERAELAVEQQLLDEHARSPRAFVPIPATRGTVRGLCVAAVTAAKLIAQA